MKKKNQLSVLGLCALGLMLIITACSPQPAEANAETPPKMRCLNESSFPQEGKGAAQTEEQARKEALKNLHNLAEENAGERCKLHKCGGEECVRDNPVKIKEEPIVVTKIVDKEGNESYEASVKATVTYDCGCLR